VLGESLALLILTSTTSFAGPTRMVPAVYPELISSTAL
jgi:hypothetical protein